MPKICPLNPTHDARDTLASVFDVGLPFEPRELPSEKAAATLLLFVTAQGVVVIVVVYFPPAALFLSMQIPLSLLLLLLKPWAQTNL